MEEAMVACLDFLRYYYKNPGSIVYSRVQMALNFRQDCLSYFSSLKRAHGSFLGHTQGIPEGAKSGEWGRIFYRNHKNLQNALQTGTESLNSYISQLRYCFDHVV